MPQITTINPATEAKVASYDVTSEAEAIQKVEACHVAFLDWRTKTHGERAVYLRNIATALSARSDDLAALMTQEMGKLLRDGAAEVELCAAIFE